MGATTKLSPRGIQTMRFLGPHTVSDFSLIDDGTLDTVVGLPDGTEYRYSDTFDYRDPDTGELDFDRWIVEIVIPDVESEG